MELKPLGKNVSTTYVDSQSLKVPGPKTHSVTSRQIVKFYTLFTSQDPKNHILFSGT